MSDLFNPDFDDEDDFWFPPDFVPDDMGDDDIDRLHNIQELIGSSVKEIIDTFDHVLTSGRGGDLRAVRFSSGAEALLWLFRRGIFMYSTLVQFPSGEWGVAIGNSPQPVTTGLNNGDIAF